MFAHGTRTSGLAALAVTCVLAATAAAAPITYTFSGTGSGELNGTAFTNANFNIVIPGDTTNVDTTTFGPDTPVMLGLTATMTLTGVGTFTLTDPVYVFNFQTGQVVGFGNDPQFDLIDLFVTGAGLDTYDLISNFGPLTTSAPFFSQFFDVGTSSGLLTFNDMSTAMFTASLDAQAVPEPITLAAFGLLAGFVLVRRVVARRGTGA